MKKIVLAGLVFYKKSSPFLHFIFRSVALQPSICKYSPTCSEYTYQAVDKYGVLKGLYLGAVRIVKCNPFSKGGYDPLK